MGDAMSEQVPGQQSEAQKLLSTLQQQFQAIESAKSGGGQGGPGSPMVTPGFAPPPPGPNIGFSTAGASSGPLPHTGPPPPQGVPRTGSESIGNFSSKTAATNAGLVSLGNSLSQMFGAIEGKEQQKKAALAENYMLQINSLIASGDPKDREKAMAILEDPKIRKILKTGLEYVPLEEEVPPEAQGVASASQKIQNNQAPTTPKKQPILPQPNQQEQLKAVMSNAIMQKLKQDPAAAISMMGGSQLTAAEQRTSEFIQNGLGLSKAQVDTMSFQEKMATMKISEQSLRDMFKAEVDVYKARVGYEGKVDAAKVFANAKDKWTSMMRDYHSKQMDPKKKYDPYAAGAKVYQNMAAQYSKLAEKATKPEDKARYEKMVEIYNAKADDYLNQSNDQDMMQMFMNAVEGGGDASDTSDDAN